MTGENFIAMISQIEEKYGTPLGDKKRQIWRIPTYDIPDEDAAKVISETFGSFNKMPTVDEWRIVCRDFRESTRVTENRERCFACNNEGVVFWSEGGGAHSALCPFCDKGASMKRRSPQLGVCEPDVARAIEHKNRSFAERDPAKRKKEIADYALGVAVIRKETGREIE